jgi:hypothetical protein
MRVANARALTSSAILSKSAASSSGARCRQSRRMRQYSHIRPSYIAPPRDVSPLRFQQLQPPRRQMSAEYAPERNMLSLNAVAGSGRTIASVFIARSRSTSGLISSIISPVNSAGGLFRSNSGMTYPKRSRHCEIRVLPPSALRSTCSGWVSAPRSHSQKIHFAISIALKAHRCQQRGYRPRRMLARYRGLSWCRYSYSWIGGYMVGLICCPIATASGAGPA